MLSVGPAKKCRVRLVASKKGQTTLERELGNFSARNQELILKTM